MTPNFFRSLEQHRVAYLLISGQATVLYQAADFSEDLDLWIEPSEPNVDRLFSALRTAEARYYKLTPPLAEKNLRAGHGFHFTVGATNSFYLDIMGQPPRVGPFADAFARRQTFDTDWGILPVIGLKDLAEIKKTQRLRDYGIIGSLARRWIERPEFVPCPAEFQWVMENIFSLTDLEALAHEHSEAAVDWTHSEYKQFVTAVARGSASPSALEDRLQLEFQAKVSALQRADREYWKPIIGELRQLKARGKLCPEGDLV